MKPKSLSWPTKPTKPQLPAPPGSPLQPHWPSGSSRNTARAVFPQGLCKNCYNSQESIQHSQDSSPCFIRVSPQMSPLKRGPTCLTHLEHTHVTRSPCPPSSFLIALPDKRLYLCLSPPKNVAECSIWFTIGSVGSRNVRHTFGTQEVSAK